MISLPPLDARRSFSKKNTSSYSLNAKRGFTLIELLVVIGILTVLFAIVLIAVNPGRQFAQANNTQRRSDVNAILNAIHQYGASNKGVLPSGIGTSATPICKAGGTVTCAGGVDLCTTLVPIYLADLPKDPKSTVGIVDPTANGPCAATTLGYISGYTVLNTGLAGGNRITVAATGEDEGAGTFSISVTR